MRARGRPLEPAREAADDCASRLRVLADETRLSVLLQLLATPKHVAELNEAIGVPQNLLSHHLRVLREAGLVVAERDGRSVLYRLAPGVTATPRGTGLDLGCCRLAFD